MAYDVIIIGSGAGGSAAAYQLVQSGRSVLLIEKGLPLPRDGSTLDTDKVLRRGLFLSDEAWLDRHGETVVPEEHFNLGGKTKWYGAALLRFSADEFNADPGRQFLGWPFGHEELAPFYDEAEELLGVHSFAVEADLHHIIAGLRKRDFTWRRHRLSLGLAPDILAYPEEAQHFDAYASVRGLKRDAETALLDRIRHKPNLHVVTGKAVVRLIAAQRHSRRVAGVLCEDGSQYRADTVMLAAGALHSPRLLQAYFEETGLAGRLPASQHVGRYYKSHILTALLAFSHRRVSDVLCKTALLTSARFPHSSVQTLGGALASDIIVTQLPAWLPHGMARLVGDRMYGLFVQTEDGSHRDNRVVAHTGKEGRPRLDYDTARTPAAAAEHRELVRTLSRQLVTLGYLPLARAVPIAGTAHACGTLMTGNDPRTSVVNANGRVHGMDNLYVVDGSVLPRSSRVNPALTIYAWALRVASRLHGDAATHGGGRQNVIAAKRESHLRSLKSRNGLPACRG
jgi:choline dehydrogenase-like flavoprotein